MWQAVVCGLAAREEQWVQGMVSSDHVFEYISRTRAAVCAA